MGGTGKKIDLRLLNIDRKLPGRLGRVGVEQYAVFPADRADRSNILDRSDLVVRKHDRHENGLRRQRRAEPVGVENPLLVDLEKGHLKS